MKTDKISRKKQAFIAFLIYTGVFLALIGVALFLGGTPDNFFSMVALMYGIFAVFTLVYVWGLIVIDKIVSDNFIPELFKGDLLTKDEMQTYTMESAMLYIPNRNNTDNLDQGSNLPSAL